MIRLEEQSDGTFYVKSSGEWIRCKTAGSAKRELLAVIDEAQKAIDDLADSLKEQEQ